jgi:hypothetical protein
VGGAFFAPLAVFLERNFALHFAQVFAGPVIEPLAYGALETDKVWLGHNRGV